MKLQTKTTRPGNGARALSAAALPLDKAGDSERVRGSRTG
jgi:hypothetical protein